MIFVCVFPVSLSFILRCGAVLVYVGISLPKVKHSVSGSSFCWSFTQLKRIKVCFLPNIITGYEMSHSGVFEAQQWWRKKLVHPIVTARTLPRGDRRETNTREGKINPNSSPYFFHSFISIQMYSVLCQSLFLKNARLGFFCTVKLYLLFWGCWMPKISFSFIVTDFPFLLGDKLNFLSHTQLLFFFGK